MTGVLPDEQGKGLGQTITEVGFNHLVGQGVETIELDVDTENTPAKRIYSSLGFATDSEIDWWEKSLER
jgi:mycothiol synthase